MRRSIVWAAGLYLAAAWGAGCAVDNTASQEENTVSCEGAKYDAHGYCRKPNGRFAKSSCCVAEQVVTYSCDVVDIDHGLNGDLLEESLGSLYDIDEDGYPNADEDATSVNLQIGGRAQAVFLGNYMWTSDDGDTIEEVPREEMEDISQWTENVVEYKVTPTGDASHDGEYSFRIFTESMAGVVRHKNDEHNTAYAIVDCRDVLSTPMAEPIDENNLRCDIAWFNYGLRDYDGQVGAPLAMDYFDWRDGYGEIDEGYINVYTDFDSEDGWDVTIGGFGYAATDGHPITFSEELIDEDLGAQLTWNITGSEYRGDFEMRVWRETGLGVIMVGEGSEGPAGMLAVIDCRGHGYPDIYSF